MSFLFLISLAAGVAWILSRWIKRPLDLRGAMRWGMGLGFLFTGVDHFASAASRYAPMIPDALAGHALAWVYFTGAADVVFRRRLHRFIGLAVPSA